MKATYPICSGRPLFTLPGGTFFEALTQKVELVSSRSDRAFEPRKAA